MAKECVICTKSPRAGFQVSHSHIRTKRRWSPNLQLVKANLNGKIQRIRVCTRCLRSGKVTRAI